MRLDGERKARVRRQLMARGQVIATLLADALAGKASEARIAAIVTGGKPGMRPAEKLRVMLDALEARRKLLDADDDRFGRCDVCAEDLGEAAVGELPWADRCAAHAAT